MNVVERLDDLVIIAKVSHPIPFRTRPLNPLALMVLRLKARESKSLPDLLTAQPFKSSRKSSQTCSSFLVYVCLFAPRGFLLPLGAFFFFIFAIEDKDHLDHTSFIDGYIPATKVLIEQKIKISG